MIVDCASALRKQKRFFVAATLGLAAVAASPVHAADVALTESGSTLLEPLFKTWVDAYQKSHPGVQITTEGSGSEAGIQKAISGQAQIGASDAYMSDAAIKQNPQIINVAVAIASQDIVYNLPGLNASNLKLDGPTLAGIYSGTIKQWNAPEIAALNPGVTLPSQQIVPIHRSEGSGDTFVFTQFLTFSTPSWENNLGYGTSVKWPSVAGALDAAGNSGMLQKIQSTPYSIGYVGASFSDGVAKANLGVAKANLGVAALKSEDGSFVLPTKETVQSAAAALTPRTPPDERLTLAYAPGAHSYPLVNYEYAVVSTKQGSPETAEALRRFLLWAIVPSETKQAYLDSVHFLSLPPHTWELSHAQIESIQ